MAHRLAPQAKVDIDEISYYIFEATSSFDLADRLVDSLYERFVLLARYPHAGRQRDDLWPGLRMFPVGDYLVLYRIDGKDVVIDRVVHGSRDLEALFDE
jgi:toxin ParE1/3/4